MKAFLKNAGQHKDVVQLLLNESELKQLYWENENEFRYNGEMYDVVEKKISGKEVIIRCISDKKETGLLNQYQRNNKHSSSNSSIVQLITAQFLLPVDDLFDQPQKIIEKKFADHSSFLQSIISSVLLPPPDVC